MSRADRAELDLWELTADESYVSTVGPACYDPNPAPNQFLQGLCAILMFKKEKKTRRIRDENCILATEAKAFNNQALPPKKNLQSPYL